MQIDINYIKRYRFQSNPSRTESLEKENKIKVVQINLTKSNSAMQELTISLRQETNFICMVTEPSVLRHRLSSIPRHYNPNTKR